MNTPPDLRITAARKAGYKEVTSTNCGAPNFGAAGGPDLVYEKDGIYLSLYRSQSAKLYTGVGWVYMEVGPFQFPGDSTWFSEMEGQLLMARIGAQSLMGDGKNQWGCN